MKSTTKAPRFSLLSGSSFAECPLLSDSGDRYRREETGLRGGITRGYARGHSFESQPEAVLGRAGKSLDHDRVREKKSAEFLGAKRNENKEPSGIWAGCRVQDLPAYSFRVDLEPSRSRSVRTNEKKQRQRESRKGAADPGRGWDCYESPVKRPKYKNEGKEVVVVGERTEWGTYKDFPYRGAHLFRDRLYAKRMSLDTDDVVDSAAEYLGRLSYTLPRVPGVPDDEEISCCGRTTELKRKAKKIVKLLKVDQSLKAVNPLPKTITCGSLRSSVRSMYAQELTVVQELSIKTSMITDGQPCSYCESLQETVVDTWKKARCQPRDVNQQHLIKFREAFARNVPEGWDRGKEDVTYVPNGHATNLYSRRDGGNWVRQAFSSEPSVDRVYSKGKPRIVTLYSGFNSEVLKPLHQRLYSCLKRRGWLLVGSPTDEKVAHLEAGCAGRDWLSFDYASATDNIKLAYVREMIDVLKQKSVGLSVDEVRCLDVLGSLSLDSGVAESGQPMGSLMSFPLLCLANKTVVDMALTTLLTSGKIQFKEWTGHRCLINGDDLLTKDVSSGSLYDEICSHGSEIGLVVNREKTMKSPEYGEINSTVFKNCVQQKKTNVSALWMGADVNDVIGFAREATTTPRGFKRLLLANATRLARQKIKTVHKLPGLLVNQILSSSRLKHAVCARPDARVPELTNIFPVVAKPDGYDLSRREEAEVIRREVNRARDEESYLHVLAEKQRISSVRAKVNPLPGEKLPGRKIYKLLRPKPKAPEKTILSCLASEWLMRQKEKLRADSDDDVLYTIVSDLSGIDRMIDSIKYWKIKKQVCVPLEVGSRLENSKVVRPCDNVVPHYVKL
ncbi:MAG: RNA-dependent RNA polymerase [Epicoccum nigrum ourmia-like virus 2]|uniref:RNA-dependent RNA polymerase n=1 Tax=Epicoccum nigrum ourmia-like virus 2 TaxID=2587556 RepID=UPI002481DEB5|nr:MAG: RNA-dependent RNA polymerase [Epicoccum nigrum ourmia-like virus 2]QDB75005.1 MAG: RNA-dependent RNA polymerase [Epicoccum nigrum ourmia-like virus 2]